MIPLRSNASYSRYVSKVSNSSGGITPAWKIVAFRSAKVAFFRGAKDDSQVRSLQAAVVGILSMIVLRRLFVVVALLGVFVLASLAGDQGAGPSAKPEEARPGPQPYYFASRQGCGRAGCHASPPTTDGEFVCRCDEYPRWAEKDLHARATKVLSEPRGRQMARSLGYDVTRAEACLQCHGVVIKDSAASDKNLVAENEGVGCCVCHGAFKDWYEPHGSYLQAEKWRSISRADKEKRFGMTDLWNPVRRTVLCVSCHVGNLDEGKFVTHEMYAAGHPPLPGFEVSTFSDAMPRHWQLRREKSPRVRELLGADAKEYEQTRLVSVGAAVSLRESMRLLARASALCLKTDDPDGRTLDYAHFDCYACHHNLKTPSERQKRGFAGDAGRAPLSCWSLALIEPGITLAFGDEAPRQRENFRRFREQVDAGLSARPYGDPEKIRPAAEALARWADELAVALDRTTWNESVASETLKLVVRFGDRSLDYDSAREIAWAVRAISHEQQAFGRKADPETEKSLSTLAIELKLSLPGTDALKIRSAYAPDRFRRSMTDLAEKLDKNEPGPGRDGD